MRLSNTQALGVAFVLGAVTAYMVCKRGGEEGFQVTNVPPGCPPMPDMSKYVLKSSIPPCPQCPDLSLYMLKTECPPTPDLSQYVLKASIPKPQPIIIDTSKDHDKKCGDCPPCPRPRCPEVKCPPPTVCPACPPCARTACPPSVVKCKAETVDTSPVRPFLAPLGLSGFGLS